MSYDNPIIIKQWECVLNGPADRSSYWVAFTHSWIDGKGDLRNTISSEIFHKSKEDAEIAVVLYLLRHQ